ncbi:uncharacterized protein LOC112504537 [Cynara cardunculus var. scolymus]|uniref:uncharacterized protein LOC112504537 n=1 Tax=Cynara cardunculus var. scolymus TaxID=59895 RepID=UPI000D629ACE|nr:uncharacterized protein LOC112504537 [Cynara cardunculus var. scolymus]
MKEYRHIHIGLVIADVTGEVVACETMISLLNNNGKPKRRMQIEIQDLEGIKIQVTLWDTFAQEFSDYVSNHKDNGVVIVVIQFAMVNIYRDFLDKTSKANIVEISETVETKLLIILGTIKAFRKDIPWFYMGCKRCNKKVRPTYTITDKDDRSGMVEEKENFECTSDRCRGQKTDVLSKFIIPLRVKDDTGIVSLTLFDREANKVLNQSATKLYEKIKEHGDLDVLLDRKFAIKIEPAEFEFVNVHSTDFSSQEKLKDVVSCTGENATLSDVDKSTTNSLESQGKLYEKRLGKSIDSKRDFEGTYDADHEGKRSATKTLKIPKLEK